MEHLGGGGVEGCFEGDGLAGGDVEGEDGGEEEDDAHAGLE
jgi:hypothetical protein